MLESTSLVLSVTELTQWVSDIFQKGLGQKISIKGELGECRLYEKDHRISLYFSLKEKKQTLSCIAFQSDINSILADYPRSSKETVRNQVERIFEPSLIVICEGSLKNYAEGGQSLYQLRVTKLIRTDSEAELLRKHKELEKKLDSLGYFNSHRKRPIPHNPESIALLTARTGAVIHDFVKTAERRKGRGAKIILFSVPVQGEKAAEKIAKAIQEANKESSFDLIVLIRGGGSKEDLACFDDELLARAIYNSTLPVLTGIGHAVDKSFADRTADQSVVTPTEAAEALWDEQKKLEDDIENLAHRLYQGILHTLTDQEKEMRYLSGRVAYFSPHRLYARSLASFEEIEKRLAHAGAVFFNREQEVILLFYRGKRVLAEKVACADVELSRLETTLSALSPEKKAQDFLEEIESLEKRLHSFARILVQNKLEKLFEYERRLKASFGSFMKEKAYPVEGIEMRLHTLFAHAVEKQGRELQRVEEKYRQGLNLLCERYEQKLELFEKRLIQGFPTSLFRKGIGIAFVRRVEQEFPLVKSAAEVRRGEIIRVLFPDGALVAKVLEKASVKRQ